MTHKGPMYLRQTTNAVIGSLLTMLERDYPGRPLTLDDVRRSADIVKTSADLDPFYDNAFEQVLALAGHKIVESQRHDSFSRLVVHPLSDDFDAGTLDRRLLHNFFFVLRSLFGEEIAAMTEEANGIADEIRQARGDDHWEVFYADPRAKRILFKVLRRIAEAFRNYDTRKAWFLNVMQHNPTSIGVSSTVYIDRGRGDADDLKFGDEEFALMFERLMKPVRNMTAADKTAFTKDNGASPEQVFGRFLEALASDRR